MLHAGRANDKRTYAGRHTYGSSTIQSHLKYPSVKQPCTVNKRPLLKPVKYTTLSLTRALYLNL